MVTSSSSDSTSNNANPTTFELPPPVPEHILPSWGIPEAPAVEEDHPPLPVAPVALEVNWDQITPQMKIEEFSSARCDVRAGWDDFFFTPDIHVSWDTDTGVPVIVDGDEVVDTRAAFEVEICHSLALGPNDHDVFLFVLDHYNLLADGGEPTLDLFQVALATAISRQADLALEMGQVDPDTGEFHPHQRGRAIRYLQGTKIKYSFSHEGNAQLVVDAMGQDLLFMESTGCFYRWNGSTSWEPIPRDISPVPFGFLSEKWEEASAAFIGHKKERAALAKWALSCGMASTVQGTTLMLRRHLALRASIDSMNSKGHLLPCQNGVWDMQSNVFRPHSREDRLTTMIPVEYDPRAQCPTYDQFMLEVLGDQDTVDMVHRQCGASLSGVVRNPVLLMCIGEGSNGKTTFSYLFHKILGSLAVQVDPAILTRAGGNADSPSPARFSLWGKRVAVLNEIAENAFLRVDEFKTLTDSSAKIRARQLYGESVEFELTTTPWWFLNDYAKLPKLDYAMRRRLAVVEFPFSFKHETDPSFRPGIDKVKDPLILDRMLLELPGILNRWMAGYVDWVEQGYHLAPTRRSNELLDRYLDSEDIYGHFIDDMLETAGNPEHRITGKEMHEAYVEWLGKGEQAGKQISTTKALRAHHKLESLGGSYVKSGYFRGFIGVKFRSRLMTH